MSPVCQVLAAYSISTTAIGLAWPGKPRAEGLVVLWLQSFSMLRLLPRTAPA